MAAMKRLALVGLFLGACGGASTAAPPAAPPDPHIVAPNVPDDAKLSREQCMELVDHAFEIYVRTNPPADDLAKAEQDRDAQKSDDSVTQCIADVNGKFYKCVIMSDTREDIDKCSP